MSKSIFDFNGYQAYLASLFGTSGETRGGRSRLAAALRCHSSYISQVLTGRGHLSLEQALLASQYLAHGEAEERFFMLLVHKAKAGSKALEAHYAKQIGEARAKRQNIRERIQVANELRGEDQMIYYSAWYYLAVHILVALPPYRTKEALARHLHLPLTRIATTLEFLVSRGLVIEEGGRYRIGSTRIHLGQGSPMLARHHANWRMRAIESVDAPDERDLHYSGVIGVSEADGRKLKAMLLSFIEQSEVLVRESKEEAAYCLTLDFFGV